MEFDEVVRKRRTIRKFSAADVPDELVAGLIDSAVRAPSSMNGQPWCFIVVRSAGDQEAACKDQGQVLSARKTGIPGGISP